MGININKIISLTFLLGSVLAGAAGVMAGLYYKEIEFMMGWDMGLKAFTAAVLGGIGNIPGAVVGGFVLGVLEALGTGYLGSQWQNIFAFAVLILFCSFSNRQGFSVKKSEVECEWRRGNWLYRP